MAQSSERFVGEEQPTLSQQVLFFLVVTEKVCLPNSFYLDFESLANEGSSLHMTRLVCAEKHSAFYSSKRVFEVLLQKQPL